jgi:diguanylate cyclase (GGDEF)-like protein/PAS domain S-box-containing protein
MKKLLNFDINYVYITFFFGLGIGFLIYNIYLSDIARKNFSHIEKVSSLYVVNSEMDLFYLQDVHVSRKKYLDQLNEKYLSILSSIKSDIPSGAKQLQGGYENILKDFSNKYDNLIIFESHNSHIISSLKKLISLEKAIQKRCHFEGICLEVNSALVVLMKTVKNFDVSDDLLKDKIIKLKRVKRSSNIFDENIDTFIRELELSSIDVYAIKSIVKDIHNLALSKSIKTFQTELINYYTNLKIQKEYVSYGFVLMSLILTIIIFLVYRSNKKNKNVLARFKRAVDGSDNTVLMTDLNKNITYVNDAFTKISGYTKDEVMGKNPSVLKSNLMDDDTYKELNKNIYNFKKWTGNFINRNKNGEIYYERASISPIVNKGKIDGFLAIKLDITELMKKEQDLVLQTEKLKISQEISHLGSWEIDWISSHVKVSHELLNILSIENYSIESFRQLISFVHPSERAEFESMFDKSIKEKSRFHMEHRVINTQGDVRYVSSRCVHKLDEYGKIFMSMGTMQDITSSTMTRKKVEYMAYHDLLTDLPNREKFFDLLTHNIKIANRNDYSIVLLSIDIDRFKDINESLGHDVGDEVLLIISKRLMTLLRQTDDLARLGGDEFAILINTVDSDSSIAVVCEKILNEIKRPIKVKDYNINLSASIGIAMYPQDGDDAMTLIKNADAAMYLSKELGRDRYRYYKKELSDKISQRLSIENALKSAIQNEEFSVVFQPQYSLVTNKIIAAEALIRWNSESLGFIPPDVFIPIAEESGLIVEIGEWVFKKSCKEFKKWKEIYKDIENVAINVSSVQLKKEDTIDRFEQITKEVGIDPSCIEIELTERYIMGNTEKNLKILQKLRDLGFRISIDDFGTGYSSMSYLKIFPLDSIKIDKSFVDNITKDKNDFTITSAIISLSKSLNYTVVAEGIETKEQENILKDQGCDVAQGYLFSRPISSNQLISFLSKH